MKFAKINAICNNNIKVLKTTVILGHKNVDNDVDSACNTKRHNRSYVTIDLQEAFPKGITFIKFFQINFICTHFQCLNIYSSYLFVYFKKYSSF